MTKTKGPVLMFRDFLKSETGATLVEYGVALVLAISAGGVALVTVTGQVDGNMRAACDVMRLDGQVDGDCGSGEDDGS